MRRLVLLFVLAAGCITGTRTRERDDRLLREISRQETWAQQAVEARATPDELARIRQSDYEAVGAGRKKLRRLLTAIDRGTWVRDAIAEQIRNGEDDPELPRTFDRAGQMRRDAASAADELADALAEGRGSLSMSDLRPGFEALRKARASDASLPTNLKPAPLPMPRPLVSAAAKVLRAHPDEQKQLDRIAADDATQIRSQLAQSELGSEEQAHREQPGPGQLEVSPQKPGQPKTAPQKPEQPRDTSAPPETPPEEQQADVPPDTLQIAGDAKSTFAKRGPPKAIVVRPDGLFALHYDDTDVIVDPGGKKVREEPAK